jgi:hypothetical protein
MILLTLVLTQNHTFTTFDSFYAQAANNMLKLATERGPDGAWKELQLQVRNDKKNTYLAALGSIQLSLLDYHPGTSVPPHIKIDTTPKVEAHLRYLRKNIPNTNTNLARWRACTITHMHTIGTAK